MTSEPSAGQLRSVAGGHFAQLYYEAGPRPEVEGVEVVLGEAPREAGLGFCLPAIQAGVARGCAELAECGEWLCSVRLVVAGVRHHEAASSPEAYARAAKRIVTEQLG